MSLQFFSSTALQSFIINMFESLIALTVQGGAVLLRRRG